MKSAQILRALLFVWAFLLVFFLSSTTHVYAIAGDGGGNLNDSLGGVGGGPAYEPNIRQQTECELHPEWTYCKTGSLAAVTYINKMTMLIGGKPDVTLANGQAVKGDKGVIGFLSGQIAFMTTTPVISGGDFVAYNLQKLTVPGVKPTYAAAPAGIGGVGYRSLFPVLELWTLVRNVSYLFFAIIFVVVGLLIILGRKLDPKTALTIQTALPKIIISLVLVTFSYAIAGFVIDLMYVAIALIFSLLGPLLDKADPLNLGGQQGLLDSILRGDIIFAFFFKTPWLAAAGGVQAATVSLADQIISGLTLGATDGGVIKDVLGHGAGVLVNLILVIAVFYALFKIWLKLIMTYIQIILAVIVGPFLIMMDAIPKPNQSNFSNWLKGLLGNAMIYPVTIIMLLIGMLVSAGVGQSGVGDGSFIAPLTGIGSAGVAQVIIGLGMLLSIPTILDKVPGWFGADQKGGGLSGLATAWAPTVTGAAGVAMKNPISERASEYSKLEEDAKKGFRQKAMNEKIARKYGTYKAELPGEMDPDLQAKAAGFNATFAGGAGPMSVYNTADKLKKGLLSADPLTRDNAYSSMRATGLVPGANADEQNKAIRDMATALAAQDARNEMLGDYLTAVERKKEVGASLLGQARKATAGATASAVDSPIIGPIANAGNFAGGVLNAIGGALGKGK